MAESEIKYTFIIPHYNIPEYLSRCIRSIPEREDIQIIVVDDCSPDSEMIPELVPELSRSNVEFYSTTIGGSAGRARNVGLDQARGTWITFIDADDLLIDNALDIIMANYSRPEDIMYFQAKSVMCKNLNKTSGRNIFQHHFDEYFNTGNEKLLRYEFDAPWGKFIKKTLIDKYSIRFDEIKYSNDTFFSAAIGVFAEKIFVSNDILYVVTERVNSLTADNMRTVEEWRIRFNSALHVQEFFDNHSIKYRRYAFADFLYNMWFRNKCVFIKEFMNVSLRNKGRYLYYYLRQRISNRH